MTLRTKFNEISIENRFAILIIFTRQKGHFCFIFTHLIGLKRWMLEGTAVFSFKKAYEITADICKNIPKFKFTV